MSLDPTCSNCGGPVIRGHHRTRHGYGGPQHESASDCVAHVRSLLTTETATREALRTQESRIMGVLADAGAPVGDVVAGVEWIAERLAAAESRYLTDMSEARAQVEDLGERLAAAEAEVARLTRERDEARANYLRCAQAIGVVDEPEGHAVQPGPIEDVERYIREAVRRGDRAIDADVARREALAEAAGVCSKTETEQGLSTYDAAGLGMSYSDGYEDGKGDARQACVDAVLALAADGEGRS